MDYGVFEFSGEGVTCPYDKMRISKEVLQGKLREDDQGELMASSSKIFSGIALNTSHSRK